MRLAPERAVAQCALGQAYVNAGRLSEAIGCFQVCANLDVNNPKPRYDLGQAYLRQALNVTSKILRADSNSPYARRIFAENFLGRNDWPEAETEYRLALKAQPRAADLRLGLAVIYMRTGHMNKAREQVARALETNPGLVAARYELAVFDFLQNDFAAAIAEVQSIAAANPKFLVSPIPSLVTAVPESGRNAACRNFSQFNPGAPQQPALAFWNQWCGPKPGSVELPRQPARLLISPLAERTGTAATLDHGCANGSCETCEAKLKPATSLRSTNPAAEAGRCFYEIGDYDTAYGRLLEALNSEAEDLATLYWFEESCRLLPDLAVREYRAAIARQPRAANIRVLLGHLEWKWQKYDEALPDLMDALRLDPDEPAATYLVGDIWVQKQEAEKALPYLQRAITLRPGFLNAKASLGRALSQLGRFQDAVREFESVASADADGSIHYQLYRLYLRLGSTEKAETCLAAAERIRSQRRRGNNLSETETP